MHTVRFSGFSGLEELQERKSAYIISLMGLDAHARAPRKSISSSRYIEFWNISNLERRVILNHTIQYVCE